MKKALSLIIAVIMLLGCMSVTAFAVDVNVKVGGTNVTSAGELDKTTFTAIKDGTVTYTMPTDTEPAKLTLNNAKIEVESQYALYSNVDLVVELIGNNEIKTEFVCSIQSGGKLTITGSGNLKINSYSHAIRGNKGLNLNMTGSLTAVGSDSSLYTRGNDISVAENAGRIYLTVSNDSKVAVNSEDGGALNIPNVFKVLGSVNCNEEEANLAEALVDGIKVKVNDTEAKTVLIYKPAGTTTDNTTDITLTVAKALTYDMVIPEDVTNLNAAGVHSVGQAKVTNVKNATEKTVISYTAATTAFKCEGKAAIPASYYTDAQGTAFPTTAVEVYKNKKDAENIPTMYVGISETAWDAAENGTYTATVTFNFEAKEDEVALTVDDILPNDLATMGMNSVWTCEPTTFYRFYKKGENLRFCDVSSENTHFDVPLTTPIAAVAGGYKCTVGDASFTFNMTGDTLTSVVAINTGTNTMNGTYIEGMTPYTLAETYGFSNSYWVNEDGVELIYSLYNFRLDGDPAHTNGLLYKSGENQYKALSGSVTFTFNIEDGALESIVVSGCSVTNCNGTYRPGK